MKREAIIRKAARAGINVRKASIPPRMTELFRALRVGEQLTAVFSHVTAPYSFAKAANVRIKCRMVETAKKGNAIKIIVERVAA